MGTINQQTLTDPSLHYKQWGDALREKGYDGIRVVNGNIGALKDGNIVAMPDEFNPSKQTSTGSRSVEDSLLPIQEYTQGEGGFDTTSTADLSIKSLFKDVKTFRDNKSASSVNLGIKNKEKLKKSDTDIPYKAIANLARTDIALSTDPDKKTYYKNISKVVKSAGYDGITVKDGVKYARKDGVLTPFDVSFIDDTIGTILGDLGEIGGGLTGAYLGLKHTPGPLPVKVVGSAIGAGGGAAAGNLIDQLKTNLLYGETLSTRQRANEAQKSGELGVVAELGGQVGSRAIDALLTGSAGRLNKVAPYTRRNEPNFAEAQYGKTPVGRQRKRSYDDQVHEDATALQAFEDLVGTTNPSLNVVERATESVDKTQRLLTAKLPQWARWILTNTGASRLSTAVMTDKQLLKWTAQKFIDDAASGKLEASTFKAFVQDPNVPKAVKVGIQQAIRHGSSVEKDKAQANSRSVAGIRQNAFKNSTAVGRLLNTKKDNK